MARSSDKEGGMRYCREAVTALAWAKAYLRSVADIIRRENGGRHAEFGDAVAIDADAMKTAEASRRKSEECKSVDMVVGLASGKKKTLCLVEAKYGVDNVENISKGDVLDKVNGTKDMLISHGVQSVREGVVLLVNERLVGKRRQLHNKLGGNPNNRILTTEQFHEKYFVA